MTEYSLLGEKILTNEGKVALREHKYKGGDPSLIYKYLLSPLADYIVSHLLPVWLA